MIAVLTGDIVNSRSVKSPQEWQDLLKFSLNSISEKRWEIYRGDSFQAELKKPLGALKSALYVKACVKTIKGLDVRLAIGIGKEGFTANKVSESYGDAYINSGERFELLKRDKTRLAISTNNEKFDEEFNLYFKLALTFMDNWTQNSAQLVKAFFENENSSQKELGALLGISQSSTSERFNRAYVAEIVELNNLFIKRIKELL
jgi:hypothetical protein